MPITTSAVIHVSKRQAWEITQQGQRKPGPETPRPSSTTFSVIERMALDPQAPIVTSRRMGRLAHQDRRKRQYKDPNPQQERSRIIPIR